MRARIIKIKPVRVTDSGRVVNFKPTFHQLLNRLSQDEKLAYRMKYNVLS